MCEGVDPALDDFCPSGRVGGRKKHHIRAGEVHKEATHRGINTCDIFDCASDEWGIRSHCNSELKAQFS